jgi:DNA repair protein RadC
LDYGPSVADGDSACGQYSGTHAQPLGLCGVDHPVRLPDAPYPRLRDLSAPEAVTNARQRSSLESLLDPLLGEASAKVVDRLLSEFGSLRAVIGAHRGHLSRVLEDVEPVVQLIQALDILIGEYLRSDLQIHKPGIDHRQVYDFLRYRLGTEPVEVAYALYFDVCGQLIYDGQISRGSYDRCHLYAKEVARMALDVGAATIIIAHNHPSGDSKPSKTDIALTREVEAVCRLVDTRLYDHIIIGNPGITSFRDERLL